MRGKSRSPESLTPLERRWLRARSCAWCDAPVHVNACYAMIGEFSPDPEATQCSAEMLNGRRGWWLAAGYKPRNRDSDGSGEAGQTAKQAGPKATARAEGIAQTPPSEPRS